MDYKKGFAYFAAGWALLFPNALGGYFELYGFLYDTIMQAIKDRFAAQRNSGWFTLRNRTSVPESMHKTMHAD